MSNHLSNENSPYLLQHADNPVDWYPWGEEALSKARLENKPIFLSIGYAACHWCHVMEHESFEDPETAALMNEHFVCIKVDREERPDLDSIYMQATTALTGSGGWPMSVFLTHDLCPFYAGTYFPPVHRYNLPSFKELLISLAKAWREQREEIERTGSQVLEHIQLQPQAKRANNLTPETFAAVTQTLLDSYDWEYGGWGHAPKFPQPIAIEFLIRQACVPTPQRDQSLKAVRHALDAMSRGGMYDVVGGGFSRYSVDELWRTPHFEKMLYDNAQLASVYLHGYLVTGERRYREVCEQTLDFLLREMAHADGGFFSSLDADSEREEGKFYVWTQDEIMRSLGPDFEFFQAAYGITAEGNWEGKTILQRALDDATLAARFPGLPVGRGTAKSDLVPAKLTECHTRLLETRQARLRPGTDDKILVSWNALALSAFAEAGRYLGRQDYLQAAIRNACFLLGNLYVDNRLLRSWREGQAKYNAYLEDYSSLSLALLALYQSDPDPKWYTMALKLADEMVAHFSDPASGFFDVRDDHEILPIRPKDVQDNAIPSGNALAATALLQLAAYGDRLEWRNLAEGVIDNLPEITWHYPTAFAQWLCAADFAVGPTYEVAVVGGLENKTTQALVDLLWKSYRPHLVAAISTYPPGPGSPALIRDRPLRNGLPTAYVCQGITCLNPVNSAAEMEAQLAC